MTNRKIFVFALCILFIFTLSGCISTRENEETESDDPYTHIMTDVPYGNFAYSPEEPVLNGDELLNDLPEDNPPFIENLVYDGEEVSFYWTMANLGESSAEYGLRVFVEGIMQEVLCDGEKSNIACVTPGGKEQISKKISFTPNVGKKGETLDVHIDNIVLPNIILPEDAVYYSPIDTSSPTYCKLKMNADSPSAQEKFLCKDYKNITVSDVNKLIYQAAIDGNENHYYDYVGTGIYKNIDNYIEADEDGNIINHVAIETTPSENDEITMNLSGKTGHYRICLMLNNKPLEVFDGCRFADVEVIKGCQTEIKVHIDTSKLSENNKLSLYYYAVDAKNSDFPDKDINRTMNYRLTVIR